MGRSKESALLIVLKRRGAGLEEVFRGGGGRMRKKNGLGRGVRLKSVRGEPSQGGVFGRGRNLLDSCIHSG